MRFGSLTYNRNFTSKRSSCNKVKAQTVPSLQLPYIFALPTALQAPVAYAAIHERKDFFSLDNCSCKRPNIHNCHTSTRNAYFYVFNEDPTLKKLTRLIILRNL